MQIDTVSKLIFFMAFSVIEKCSGQCQPQSVKVRIVNDNGIKATVEAIVNDETEKKHYPVCVEFNLVFQDNSLFLYDFRDITFKDERRKITLGYKSDNLEILS